MSKVLRRGAFAMLLALAFALVALPAAAFADDQPTPGTIGVYLQVQTGVDDANVATWSEPQLVKNFDASEVNALAAENTAVHGAMYSGKKGVSVLASKKYVRVDQLLTASNIDFVDGDVIHFTCTDGDYQKFEAAYADVTGANKFFPAYTGAEDYDASGAVDSPAVLAFEYGSDAIATTAGAAKDSAAAKAKAENFAKFSIGETAENYAKGLRPGNNFPTDVVSITVRKPVANAQFTVFAADQNGTDAEGKATFGSAKLVKTFTSAEIKALAAANTEVIGSMYSGKNNTVSVLAAKGYVTVEQMLDAAGLQLIASDSLQFVCTDGVYKKFAAEGSDVLADNQFFPAYAGGTDYDATGAVASPAAFAFDFGKDGITTTAGAAKDSAAAKSKAEDFATFVIGETAENYANGLRPGNNFPNGVVSVTVNQVAAQDISAATVTFPETSVVYTGEAIVQEPTVELNGAVLALDRDYTYELSDNVNAGTAKAAITGVGRYTGTAEGTFTIAKASQKIAAKSKVKASKVYKAKNGKLTKARTLNVKKLAGVSAKTTVKFAKSGKVGGKKITVTKKGKMTLKKGLKSGTYKVKVKLTAAGNSNYKAAKAKTITVIVRVK